MREKLHSPHDAMQEQAEHAAIWKYVRAVIINAANGDDSDAERLATMLDIRQPKTEEECDAVLLDAMRG